MDSALVALLCFAAVVALTGLIGCALLWRSLVGARTAEAGARRRAERAVAATETTSLFVAGVAHELRTPLTSIIGFTELMRDGRAGTVNRHQHEYLGIVRSSAGNLVTLIDEVLDSARVQAGHLRIDPAPVAPAAIGQECIVPLRHLADEGGVHLDYRCQEPGTALLDPDRLRQVIVNLVSNAVKFTDAGGRVTLTVSRRGQRLLISVTDTGIGIAEQDRDRIFEPFVRLEGREQPGSGLGLALTRELVRAQGGSIGVESRLGVGSTFTVWLPWVGAEAAPSHPAADWQQTVAGLGLVSASTGPQLSSPPRTADPYADLARAQRTRRFRPGARRGPVAADAASRPASAPAARL